MIPTLLAALTLGTPQFDPPPVVPWSCYATAISFDGGLEYGASATNSTGAEVAYVTVRFTWEPGATTLVRFTHSIAPRATGSFAHDAPGQRAPEGAALTCAVQEVGFKDGRVWRSYAP